MVLHGILEGYTKISSINWNIFSNSVVYIVDHTPISISEIELVILTPDLSIPKNNFGLGLK